MSRFSDKFDANSCAKELVYAGIQAPIARSCNYLLYCIVFIVLSQFNSNVLVFPEPQITEIRIQLK